MFDKLFQGLFDTAATQVISPGDFLLCLASALVIGLMLAFTFMYRSRHTKSFVFTLALLPAVVCVVIMMVNGNIGAGVAVAGAFSLVRFRSAPGTAKEIGMLFLAMGAGLICGMGYLAYGFLFACIMCLICLVYNLLNLGAGKQAALHKILNITIPEELNYTDVFEPLLQQYASEYELVKVKTTNMGSLFRLTYSLTLKKPGCEKQLMDQLRCRNGNLEISICRQEQSADEL